ncbi:MULTISPECIES: polysaccharide pyruvyl transferase family protein [unclassified Adlercreutzia]|uniref:polysaccharide pyruvyl transferase family protein n=1 Tax=unclassified Adlercreutzia TaxID=2636013 RepID=UPI0013EA41DC|nr:MULTISPECIES: polysaccharide pyruvyl transferase family protein [unclassified Adlercreutzia]
MSKIALMTWFQYHNYGTALQVTALSRVLSSLGNEVDVIDYRAHGRVVAASEESSLVRLAGKARNKAAYHLLRRPCVVPAREELFEAYLDDRLSFTSPCPTLADLEALNDVYDTFVCGSDQIWAPSVFDPHYFLNFAAESRLKVAYAPSVGLPEVRDGDVARRMGELASRIDRLSTREESGSGIISELTGRKVATVLDPTFLLRPDEWAGIAGCEADGGGCGYLLAYMLGSNELQWRRVYEIAERKGLDVRVIPVFQRDLKRKGCLTRPVGPREFVALVAGASYVCTDSFHGVAFSINFKREFCAFERFREGDPVNQNSRVHNILARTGLEGRLAARGKGMDDLVKPIDWTPPCDRLDQEREASLSWLKDALASAAPPESHKNNVLRNRSLCCGCSACEVVCPVGAVGVSLDAEGFWRAEVDEAVCISCGKCRATCPFIERSTSLPIGAGSLYSFKSSDAARLLSSSSGGAAAAIAERASAEGAATLGCAFDLEGGGAAHRLVLPGDAEGLASLAGSKYMQSRMSPALAEAAVRKEEVVVFGTPCQVAGARNLLARCEGVTYVDLICHGVPSRHLYERYREWLHGTYGLNPSIVRTEFRYKPRGWRERYVYSTDGEREACLHQRKDPYFLLFEAGQCYAGCCYECPWRSASAADVRLGDYWGPRFEGDETGVSMVLAMTDRGREVTGALSTAGALKEQPLEDYISWQQTRNEPEPVFRERLLSLLSDPSISIEDVAGEFAEPIARERDLRRSIAPLARIAKRVLGKSHR